MTMSRKVDLHIKSSVPVLVCMAVLLALSLWAIFGAGCVAGYAWTIRISDEIFVEGSKELQARYEAIITEAVEGVSAAYEKQLEEERAKWAQEVARYKTDIDASVDKYYKDVEAEVARLV